MLWHRAELYVDFMLLSGAMMFVNNRLLMHARTAYEGWPEVGAFSCYGVCECRCLSWARSLRISSTLAMSIM